MTGHAHPTSPGGAGRGAGQLDELALLFNCDQVGVDWPACDTTDWNALERFKIDDPPPCSPFEAWIYHTSQADRGATCTALHTRAQRCTALHRAPGERANSQSVDLVTRSGLAPPA